MTADERYSFGPFELDVSTRVLARGGEKVALTSKAFDTLLALVRHRDRIVPKDELIQLVWPDAFVSEDSLTHSVSVLRRTLGDSSSQPQFIATVPRRGYRFIAPVEVLPPADPLPEAAAAEIAQQEAAPSLPQPAPIHLPVHAASAPIRPRRSWAAMGLVVAVAAAVVLMVGTARTVPRGVVPTGSIRFVLEPPKDYALSSGAALSPDGRYLTFVAREHGTGRPQLWVRSLESLDMRVLKGTEGAFRPFWSPDGGAIAFFSGGKLKRIPVVGGTPQTLASVGYRPSGGTWSNSGVIVFSDRRSQLFSVPATGGEAHAVTTLDAENQEVAHQAASFLPDGRHFLYFAASTNEGRDATYVGSLDSTERVKVLDATASSAIYAPPGYLLFVRDGVLMAQRFDTSRMRLTGAPMTVAPNPEAAPDTRVSVISTSTTGLLTFGGDTPSARLVWFSRDGTQLNTVDAPTALHNPTISPDRRYIAADASGGGPQSGIWLIDIARNAPTRFSDGIFPVWGPDQGSQISFTYPHGSGHADIVVRSLAGSGDSNPVLAGGPDMKIGGNWTTDRQLVFTTSNPKTRLDLWTLPHGGSAGVPYLETPFNETQGQVSPDGHWIAYTSDESGSWEVYLQTFPMPGNKRTISIGGGAQPQWRRDGRELYYISPDGALMAVNITLGASPAVERPKVLFHPPILADMVTFRNQYAVDADGQRFLFDSAGEREPINVVVNWNALINP